AHHRLHAGPRVLRVPGRSGGRDLALPPPAEGGAAREPEPQPAPAAGWALDLEARHGPPMAGERRARGDARLAQHPRGPGRGRLVPPVPGARIARWQERRAVGPGRRGGGAAHPRQPPPHRRQRGAPGRRRQPGVDRRPRQRLPGRDRLVEERSRAMSDSNIIPGRPPGYPVSFDVQRQLTDRNRATTAFRLILAVPQLIIVGGGAFALRRYGTGAGIGGGGLSSAATAMTIVAWFGIVFASRHPRGLWDFAAYYMRWRVRVGAYVALFRDDYPPFGDEPYP